MVALACVLHADALSVHLVIYVAETQGIAARAVCLQKVSRAALANTHFVLVQHAIIAVLHADVAVVHDVVVVAAAQVRADAVLRVHASGTGAHALL